MSGIGLSQIAIVHPLHESVVACRKQSAHERAYPIYPVVAREAESSNARAEGSGRVDRGAGVVDASDLNEEERQADTYRCDERVFGLFGGEYKDREDELRSEKL